LGVGGGGVVSFGLTICPSISVLYLHWYIYDSHGGGVG
jgi:hypothetical protein